MRRKKYRPLVSSILTLSIALTSITPILPVSIARAETNATQGTTIPAEKSQNPSVESQPKQPQQDNNTVLPQENVKPFEKVKQKVTTIPEKTPNKEKQAPAKPVQPAIDFNNLPELLITEIMANNVGTDEYEYIEVYNNSDKPLVLDHYTFAVRYTDGSGADQPLQFKEATIGPKETRILWLNVNNKSLVDFNTHYGLQLIEEQVVQSKNAIGLYNGGNRGIVIHNGEKEIAFASYEAADIAEGLAVQYTYPDSGTVMKKHAQKAQPTLGKVDAAQVPLEAVKLPGSKTPIVNHSPIQTAVTDKDIKVSATVTGDKNTKAVLSYQAAPNAEMKSLPMKKTADKYEAIIPAGELVPGTLRYSIKVTDTYHRVTLPGSDAFAVAVSAPVKEDFNNHPHVLITELAPNSKGPGTDYYEYFELYNNTNQPLHLANYTFVYRYTDTGAEKTFQVPAVTMDPQSKLVFWFNNGDKALADFNDQYGTSLTAKNVVEFKDIFPGFANGGNRALVLKDQAGNEVISASYLDKETDNDGKVVQYSYPKSGTAMNKLQVLANPSPGSIDVIQVPEKPVNLPDEKPDKTAPVITHTAVTKAEAYTDVKIEANITDDVVVSSAALYYKKEQDKVFTSVKMKKVGEKYTADIPGQNVDSNLIYYIEASDGTNIAKTSAYTIAVEKPTIDFNKVPMFLVTEIVPDSTNVGGADGYEFVEIYNNTDRDINFKDYKMQYRYGAESATDVIWPSVPDDVVIKSRDTLVFWIINGENGDKTVADFNNNYGTNLVENKNIVRIYSPGMANGSMRGLVVADNTKQEIAVSYYNDQEGVDDTQPDKGILYTYPVNGSTISKKISAGVENATPGSVQPNQVPVKPVHVEEDKVKPTIENVTRQTEVKETEDIKLSVDAKDDKGVKTVRVFYKTNDASEYKSVILQRDYNSLLFKHTIYSPEIIGKQYVEYYFVVSDGMNEVRSDTYKVKVISERDTSSLRINVKDNEILAGKKIIKGTSQDEAPSDVNLLIDNKEVKDTYHSLESTSYLAFEVSDVDTFFQNGVTMGDEVLHIFDDGILEWQTITVPIDPKRLKLGENVLTIRSGNKASPFDLESTENRDDYGLRNVRLVLNDGTIITDPTYSNPNKVIAMSDENPFVDFKFTMTEANARSKAYKWDTKAVADGAHTVTVRDSNEEIQRKVIVDNTAPVITPSIEKGKQYKGEFVINPVVTDALAGVSGMEVILDGKQIFTPYKTSSSQLTPGMHKLYIKATDKAGNVSEAEVPFTTSNEIPNKPELIAPIGTAEGTPTLSVKVTDPTNDNLDVVFYKAYQYKPSHTSSVKSYENKVDLEPPQTGAPTGERLLTGNDISLISAEDGKYLTTDSTTQFPYHRFDVTLDNAVDDTDIVELVWKGKSLEGRKVTMYAWSYIENKWKAVTYNIAKAEDFTLKGNVQVAEYAKDHKVNVLVQDEIPTSPKDYDYTFVWMSDTQYYSKSYPQIYDAQTKWIAEKKDELKIKYVFHTGDLVDEAGQDYQWNNADRSMKVLDDANVPYGVLAGNHDVDHKSVDYTQYYKYFSADRFKDKPYYGGTYKNNRGHYDLISAGGNDYIMVYLGWGVDEEGIAWVNEVLAAHPDRKAILNFHEYMLSTGARHPLGDKLYKEIVLRNPNVIAVLSGHYHESQKLVDEIDDNGDGKPDRKVYQLLADYQSGPEGGQGYMRLLHIDKKNNRIIVNTYSPYMNDYNFYNTDLYGDKDEFVMDLDMQPKEKRVATDYFAVNVYTDSVIGTAKNVKSGQYAEAKWTGLEENKTYSWYVTAADQFTGKVVSDIWTFTKGKNTDTTEPGTGEKPDTGTGGNTNTGGNSGSNPGGTPSTGTGGTSGSNQTSPPIQTPNRVEDSLPNTGTNIYNMIAGGIILTIAGIILYRVRRKKSI
ncbi:lamin tail domain-containing protein [Microbacteriaceae bacterium 4G12]